MRGLPVTIRLLDPPLHEFVPDSVELHEVNPMLGTRGCRVGLVHPEIYEMQVRAIVRAALATRRPGSRSCTRWWDSPRSCDGCGR